MALHQVVHAACEHAIEGAASSGQSAGVLLPGTGAAPQRQGPVFSILSRTLVKLC